MSTAMKSLAHRVIALCIALSLIGCCAPSPSPATVRSWAGRDLPIGASHDQVLRFCSDHGFSYFENDPHAAMATKPAGGCAWSRQMIWMNLTFDDDRRVKSVQVWGGMLERSNEGG